MCHFIYIMIVCVFIYSFQCNSFSESGYIYLGLTRIFYRYFPTNYKIECDRINAIYLLLCCVDVFVCSCVNYQIEFYAILFYFSFKLHCLFKWYYNVSKHLSIKCFNWFSFQYLYIFFSQKICTYHKYAYICIKCVSIQYFTAWLLISICPDFKFGRRETKKKQKEVSVTNYVNWWRRNIVWDNFS